MRGGAPPDLLEQGVLWTAGAVGVLVATTIVAAPGANRRIRLWEFTVAYDHTASGDSFGLVGHLADNINGGYWAVSDEGRAFHKVLPGGLALLTNRVLEIQQRGTVAGIIGFVSVLYTVEDV